MREEDCFASRGERVRGMEVTDIVSNGQVIETLEDRINGRVAAEPVVVIPKRTSCSATSIRPSTTNWPRRLSRQA